MYNNVAHTNGRPFTTLLNMRNKLQTKSADFLHTHANVSFTLLLRAFPNTPEQPINMQHFHHCMMMCGGRGTPFSSVEHGSANQETESDFNDDDLDDQSWAARIAGVNLVCFSYTPMPMPHILAAPRPI